MNSTRRFVDVCSTVSLKIAFIDLASVHLPPTRAQILTQKIRQFIEGMRNFIVSQEGISLCSAVRADIELVSFRVFITSCAGHVERRLARLVAKFRDVDGNNTYPLLYRTIPSSHLVPVDQCLPHLFMCVCI